MAGDSLPTGWQLFKLGDLGRIVTGKTPSTKVPDHFGVQVPFVTPSDMDGRRIIAHTERYLSKLGVESVGNCQVPAGAVMVSCIGSDMGKVAIAGRDCVTNQQINSIIVDEKWCADYVYYSLVTRKAEFQSLAGGGSAQPILNKGHFAQISIVVPPLPEQRAIAHILGTVDDKIDLNRRMNETLEAMAGAIFKSWFVDFDPVRAKAEGRDPGLPKHIADLFPDRLEDSELGEIPAGWDVRGLDEIATFLNGLALQKYPPTGGRSLPVIKIAQLRRGDTAGADRASADIPQEYVIADGDVLFSWSGSLECELWTGGEGALNQHVFKVTSAAFPKWFYYLWIHEHLPSFRQIAAGKATTMGHIQRHHLSDANVTVPDRSVLAAADKTLSPMIDQIIQRRIESRTLATLCDTLLPKLISGKIRVNDAERLVGKRV